MRFCLYRRTGTETETETDGRLASGAAPDVRTAYIHRRRPLACSPSTMKYSTLLTLSPRIATPHPTLSLSLYLSIPLRALLYSCDAHTYRYQTSLLPTRLGLRGAGATACWYRLDWIGWTDRYNRSMPLPAERAPPSPTASSLYWLYNGLLHGMA